MQEPEYWAKDFAPINTKKMKKTRFLPRGITLNNQYTMLKLFPFFTPYKGKVWSSFHTPRTLFK